MGIWNYKELGWTDDQIILLQTIHNLVQELERRGQDGKKHFIISLLEELTAEYIDYRYLREKFNGLLADETKTE